MEAPRTPKFDPEVMKEVEAEAAHAASEAFLRTAQRVMKERGLPDEAMQALVDTSHVHWMIVLAFKDVPVAVRTQIMFTQSEGIIRELVDKYKREGGIIVPQEMAEALGEEVPA